MSLAAMSLANSGQGTHNNTPLRYNKIAPLMFALKD